MEIIMDIIRIRYSNYIILLSHLNILVYIIVYYDKKELAIMMVIQ